MPLVRPEDRATGEPLKEVTEVPTPQKGGVPEDRVQAVASSELPFPELRPRRAILDNRALRAIGLDTLSSWQDALTAYLEEMAAG